MGRFSVRTSILQTALSGDASPFSPRLGRKGLLYRMWHQLVETYSQSALTYYSDKPIAIAGLAKAFQRYLQLDPIDYVCGNWRPNLVRELLWCCAGGKRSYDNRIPTWSWLSIDPGTVCWYLEDDFEWVETAEIVEFNVLQTDDPFINSMSRPLVLRGAICEITVSRNEDPCEIEYLNQESGDLWGFAMTIQVHCLSEEDGFLTKLDDDSEEFVRFATNQPLYLSLVRVAEANSGPKASSEQRDDFSLNCGGKFECLILNKTVDDVHFRRIGYFMFDRISQYSEQYVGPISVRESLEKAKISCRILERAFKNYKPTSDTHHGTLSRKYFQAVKII
ncbi:hypothetical protein DM02DRAFT_710118 [Periconia macrospinosa]|uniref:Heterokaryon incompatibility domain-containing protein n=1 Tax=Periconia macrospinosa TaxID=97972 RepID=A0A2V1DRE0_9PLEO|nr:hypothetical protein DM02DRAFT_710118 [Periconia macrospinosa]